MDKIVEAMKAAMTAADAKPGMEEILSKAEAYQATMERLATAALAVAGPMVLEMTARKAWPQAQPNILALKKEFAKLAKPQSGNL